MRMDNSLFGNKPYQMSDRQRRLVIVCLMILFSVWGYYQIRPNIGHVPERPNNFTLIFKYGIGSRNILDTREGTFTKDLILDPPITVELSLTEEELQTVWVYLHRNHFYDMPESIPHSSNTVITPHETYKLTVWAEGYPKKKVIMDDPYGRRSLEERRCLRIAGRLKELIRSKPVYKTLPEPRGAYE